MGGRTQIEARRSRPGGLPVRAAGKRSGQGGRQERPPPPMRRARRSSRPRLEPVPRSTSAARNAEALTVRATHIGRRRTAPARCFRWRPNRGFSGHNLASDKARSAHACVTAMARQATRACAGACPRSTQSGGRMQGGRSKSHHHHRPPAISFLDVQAHPLPHLMPIGRGIPSDHPSPLPYGGR